jgi:GNAT superfamily N-acetyltransferase
LARTPVVVNVATEDDLERLLPLWDECRAQAGAGVVSGGTPDVLERVRAQMASSREAVELDGRPTYRLVYACVDGEPAGLASFTVVSRGLLAAACGVLVDVVHVADAQRKHGVGTNLLREAVAFADEVGAGDVVVNVPPNARDVNRFYARLGFAPLVVRRSAPVGHLRRKLGVEARLDPRDVTIDLTPVQRSLRRRALLHPRRSAVRP